ncbi:MAG: hypothetical protein JW768_09050 [Chitinispirillaceae bacterium]|nr:hypothetical protein [Chitinispirillaceae bacterium]
MNKKPRGSAPFLFRFAACICMAVFGIPWHLVSQDSTNTITRSDFNFGHQLGYMYSRMDNAWFENSGLWVIQTGFLAFHTPMMPRVRNPAWQERTILMVPLYVQWYPCSSIAIQAEITDLFVEFPYVDLDNTGGKSPRFKTKIRILSEKTFVPAFAFTAGVKFSSAKPYTIWDNDHNYDESNGLAGAGTGVADYLLLCTASKTVRGGTSIHARLGLAPLGSPVEFRHGSAQADEIPYGVMVRHDLAHAWSINLEVSGMYNGLRSTHLAHYSVVRGQIHREFGPLRLTLNGERGLTEETDTWVGGAYLTARFQR